jgi:hypothetical protein
MSHFNRVRLGILCATSGMALFPGAHAAAQTPNASPRPQAPIRLSMIDTSTAAFRKLDGDHDGRISALEANQNPRVAAAFLVADKDKDGYLSREEFEAISSAVPVPPDTDASSPSGDQVSDPGGDEPSTPPSERSDRE